ncbi:hypothetical protein [Vibrio parahaemolyticus]|uniref:hypothetical protein n=1 Tax=Vibrio parahaemolyticus TaxID=670 RepID=UPI001D16F52A|nr:hypothetical protein [Vibrio parahaemolyticus]MCC3791020.1 hypothetical protein [Vibrio parahaemolyticus]
MEQTTPQKTNSQHQKRFWKTNLTMRAFNKATETTRTYQARENAISASKPAFVPTNSTSRVSAKKFDSVNPKVAAPKNKSTVETMPILDFHHAN